jgi:hypothetical protein
MISGPVAAVPTVAGKGREGKAGDAGRLLAGLRRTWHHGPKHERRPMSDIGSIFSTWDIILMILVACAPGFVIGAAFGAWRNPGRRLRGALFFGLTGFALAFAGWWLYLTVIK